MRTILAALVLLACSSFVHAQSQAESVHASGNAFLRLCSAVDKDVNELTQRELLGLLECLGYVDGYLEGVIAEAGFVDASKGDKKTPTPYCQPTGLENPQTIRIVLKYIHNHPEEAHAPTALLMFEALSESFPCSNAPPAAKK